MARSPGAARTARSHGHAGSAGTGPHRPALTQRADVLRAAGSVFAACMRPWSQESDPSGRSADTEGRLTVTQTSVTHPGTGAAEMRRESGGEHGNERKIGDR